MKKFSALFLVLLGCSGLHVDQGNAFPCDYASGAGVRDSACVAGDVCGPNNVCQSYIYEGPRFEGAATVPSYGEGSDAGARLHPLVLKTSVTGVTRDLPLNGPRSNLYVRVDPGQYLALTERGNLLEAPPMLPNIPGLNTATFVQPFTSDPGGRSAFLAVSASNDVVIAELAGVGLPTTVRPGVGNFNSPRVRFLDIPPPSSGRPSSGSLPVVWDAQHLGFVTSVPGPMSWRYQEISEPNLPELRDVGSLSLGSELWVAFLRDQELALRPAGNTDGGSPFAPLPLSTLASVDEGTLRSDRDGRALALVRRGRFSPGDDSGDVLSTYSVSSSGGVPVLTSAWPDCEPCAANQRIQALTVSVATGRPVVEVICVGALNVSAARRVLGSVALTPSERCLVESFETTVPLNRLVRGGSVIQFRHQSETLIGGEHGELWTGSTLSSLKPAFLDRVPRDVAPALTQVGNNTLAAIGEDFYSVLQTPEILQVTDAGAEKLNGFRRIPTRDLGGSDDARLLGFVHGTAGWGVTSTGDVVRAAFGPQGVKVSSNQRLVKASGEPIFSSIGGEAFVATDGGLQGVFLAADDSVYFVRDPRSVLTATSLETQPLPPELTPEPSVPVRSLALERTPLGTDGVTRARGYLVTSRNVYSWGLSGSPSRWTSTPIALPGGEPLEVWFDQPRSALGRVGFRSGEIDSLPGGYQLANPLPDADGGVPAQVIDYENLGGWPVAYATTGLFIAGWEQKSGVLQNRFPDGGINRPMDWTEVTLPNGARPWMGPRQARAGRLFVVVDPRLPESEGSLQPHRLLLFLDDQVIEVARHLRK